MHAWRGLIAVGVLIALLALPASAAAKAGDDPDPAAGALKLCAAAEANDRAASNARKAVDVATSAVLKADTGDKPRAQADKAAAETALTAAERKAIASDNECDLAQKSRDAKHWTRGILIGSIVLILLLSSFLYRGLMVGVDKRFSTSKTTAAVWTSLLAGTLLAVVVAKLAGYPQALDKILNSGLAGQYGLLIGGPLGAALAAKGIVGSRVADDPNVKTEAKSTTPLHIIQDDTGETDLVDFQYVLFNLVAMVYFVGSLIQAPVDGLPEIPDVLLGLTSVSALGYVTKKALPSTPPAAKISPPTGPPDEPVTITGTGLVAGKSETAPVKVLFGTRNGKVGDITENGTDAITVVPPDGLTPGTPVDVVVITPSLARVTAGKFTLNKPGRATRARKK